MLKKLREIGQQSLSFRKGIRVSWRVTLLSLSNRLRKVHFEKPGFTIAIVLLMPLVLAAFVRELVKPILPPEEPANKNSKVVSVDAKRKSAQRPAPAKLKPVLRLDRLEEYRSREFSEETRDLFEFEEPPPPPPKPKPPPPKPKPSKQLSSKDNSKKTVQSPPPPKPPPPPRVNFPGKYIGYFESTTGVRQAMVRNGEFLFVVQKGDQIARFFRVVSIAPNMLEVLHEPTSTRQKLRFVP